MIKFVGYVVIFMGLIILIGGYDLVTNYINTHLQGGSVFVGYLLLGMWVVFQIGLFVFGIRLLVTTNNKRQE